MFLNRNKKHNVYPCKPQFYYIKVGFKGVNIIYACFVMEPPRPEYPPLYGDSFVCRLLQLCLVPYHFLLQPRAIVFRNCGHPWVFFFFIYFVFIALIRTAAFNENQVSLTQYKV